MCRNNLPWHAVSAFWSCGFFSRSKILSGLQVLSLRYANYFKWLYFIRLFIGNKKKKQHSCNLEEDRNKIPEEFPFYEGRCYILVICSHLHIHTVPKGWQTVMLIAINSMVTAIYWHSTTASRIRATIPGTHTATPWKSHKYASIYCHSSTRLHLSNVRWILQNLWIVFLYDLPLQNIP